MSQTDINILIVGETGVGKSTFINAFANYLIYNTLPEAMRGEMQVLIPSTSHMTDPDSADFESKKIFVGIPSDNEECGEVGQSCTQVCHSYIFPIGNRLLRLIDAPGVGDVRGVAQDAKNCDHILSYLHAYEHLNGICVLLKPNNERLTIGFRFCFKEILTHLHISAKDNLMFIFTNGRATFYQPLEMESNFQRMKLTILVEVGRKRVLQCELHAVRDSLSINDAQQLICLLSRPAGEIARLIQENIQLAQKYKQDVLKKPSSAVSKQFPQLNGKMIKFDYPRTVCTNGKCTQTIVVNDRQKMNYKTHCHPQCYLRDVERECIGHSILQHCDAIHRRSGLCKICRCHWKEHMHISYEYETHITYVDLDDSSSRSLLTSIDRRFEGLRKEEDTILQTCGELSQFVKQTSITPYNDDILEYIKYFIGEEQVKRGGSTNNDDIIKGLQKMVEDYEREKKLFDASLQSQTTNSASHTGRRLHSSEDVFDLVAELYKLPINGASIKQQIDGLKQMHIQGSEEREHRIQTPSNINSSTIMQQLKQLVDPR